MMITDGMPVRKALHSLMGVILLLAGMASECPAQAGDAPLRVGDVLDLRISGVPGSDVAQVSGTYTIDNEGMINLPYIGKMRAAGVNAGDLQTMIQNRYMAEQIYSSPTIVITTAGGGRFVNVSGDVRSPQRVVYTPDLTLLKAITAAGDFTDYANDRKVRLLRSGEVMVVDVKKIRENPSLDIPLKPGDDIYVPQSWF